MFNRNAQIWISAVLYILLISSSLLIVVKFALPILENMKDKNTFEKSKNMMATLDDIITDVANGGEGNQRVVTIDIPDGKMFVENNKLIWEYQTDSEVLDDRSSQEFENLRIVSNANVESFDYSNYYMLSTSLEHKTFPLKFNATIKKYGSEQSWVPINSSQLIINLSYGNIITDGVFNIYLNNDPATGIGNGYTYIVPKGNNSNLGQVQVIAHINSTDFEYDIILTLNSYSDFLVIETKNIEIKNG